MIHHVDCLYCFHHTPRFLVRFLLISNNSSMESGTINISGTQDDGIQCDIDGDASTGETADHEDEDSGNVYIEGGTINITINGGSSVKLSSYTSGGGSGPGGH